MKSKVYLFTLLFIALALQSEPKNIIPTLIPTAKKKLVERYNTFNLEPLHLDTEINPSIGLFFRHHPGTWPTFAQYEYSDTNGITKKITYIGSNHHDAMTMKILRHVLESNIFDLGIGEWPTLGNTLTLHRFFALRSASQYGPNTKKTIIGSLINPTQKLDETAFLEKALKQKSVPIINGEQTVQEYLADLVAAGLTEQDIIACNKWASQSGYGTGNSGNSKTYKEIRNATAKILGAIGIHYNPNNTTISSRTIRHAGSAFNNVSIKKSISYTPEQTKIAFTISMISRDCCILTKLLSALQDHNNIIIVYGSAHWFTQKDVLERYLGKPKTLYSGPEYIQKYGL